MLSAHNQATEWSPGLCLMDYITRSHGMFRGHQESPYTPLWSPGKTSLPIPAPDEAPKGLYKLPVLHGKANGIDDDPEIRSGQSMQWGLALKGSHKHRHLAEIHQAESLGGEDRILQQKRRRPGETVSRAQSPRNERWGGPWGDRLSGRR